MFITAYIREADQETCRTARFVDAYTTLSAFSIQHLSAFLANWVLGIQLQVVRLVCHACPLSHLSSLEFLTFILEKEFLRMFKPSCSTYKQ